MSEVTSDFKIAGTAAWDKYAQPGSGNGGLPISYDADMVTPDKAYPRATEVGRRRTLGEGAVYHCERCGCRLNHMHVASLCFPCEGAVARERVAS